MLSKLTDLLEVNCAKLSQYKRYFALYIERGKSNGKDPDIVYLAKTEDAIKKRKSELGAGEVMPVSDLIKKIVALKNSKEENDRNKYTKICDNKATRFFVLGSKEADKQATS